MKVKGIPIWEQKLEFIVLGVAVLAFAALVAMQFIGNPNAVEDRTQGMITPSNVDELLEEQAARLRPHFEDNASPAVDIPMPDPVLPEFERRLSSAVSPTDTIAMPQVAFAPTADSTVIVTDVAFVEPEIAEPYDVIAQQYFDALPDSVVQQHEALAAYVGDKPYDVSWITAAASFDIRQVLDEFQRSGPDGSPAPVPPSWYGGRVTILDVVIERQQQVNGGWSNLEVVEPLPGQFTLRPELSRSDLAPADRDQMQQQLLAGRQMAEIMQPEFYETRNASWYPPVDQAETDELTPDMTEDEREILRLKRELTNVRRELSRVEDLLEKAGGELYGENNNRPSGGDDGGASGGRTPGGGGMAGGSQRGRRNPGGEAAGERNDAKRRTLTTKRDRLLEDFQRIESQLSNLGEQVASATDIQDSIDPFSQDTVRVWGHDLGIDPGATYRYRFTIRVMNPYFKHEVHLLDDQKHLADSIYIASAASEWSQPIIAKPPLETFVINATAPQSASANALGRLDLGQASVEIFRFYDGRWWKERFAVEPGERIGEEKIFRQRSDEGVQREVAIDFGTDWYVLDIVNDMSPGSSSDRGKAASVLLQNITYPDQLAWRHPRNDSEAFRRQELDERVRIAELSDGAQASAQ